MSEKKSKNHSLNTGNKAFDVIIVIVFIISALGIIAFTYSGIAVLIEGGLSALFSVLPNIMYVMMYISIIQYCITFFIKKQQASIYAMLHNYCMLILMSTIIPILPSIAQHVVLILLVILVVILVPMMQKDLADIKRCFIILAVVFALVACMTAYKICYGCVVVGGENPFLYMVSVYSAFHPLFVWIIFAIVYLIRVKLAYNKDKDRIEEEGFKAVQEDYRKAQQAFLEAEDEASKKAKEEKKAKIKQKFHRGDKDAEADAGSAEKEATGAAAAADSEKDA